MHHKYHTESLILGSSDYKEAGKIFFVFTREFGLLYAAAAGIRKMSSKLRYVLQDFAYVKVDLLKGRDFWRITSASKTNELEEVGKHEDTLKVFAHIATLLRRLLPEQEENEALFEEVLGGLMLLEKAKNKEEVSNIEIIIVLRILNNLGYIGDVAEVSKLVHSPFKNELVVEMAENKLGKSKAIVEINKALRETQL